MTTTGPREAVEPSVPHVGDDELDDLRRRLRAARLPEAETVAAADGPSARWSQAVPLAYLDELRRY